MVAKCESNECKKLATTEDLTFQYPTTLGMYSLKHTLDAVNLGNKANKKEIKKPNNETVSSESESELGEQKTEIQRVEYSQVNRFTKVEVIK